MLSFVVANTPRPSILSPNVPVAFVIIVICFPLRLQHSHASSGNGIVVNVLSNCCAPSFSEVLVAPNVSRPIACIHG